MEAQVKDFPTPVAVILCLITLVEEGDGTRPIRLHLEVAKLNDPFVIALKEALLVFLPGREVHASGHESRMIAGQISR